MNSSQVVKVKYELQKEREREKMDAILIAREYSSYACNNRTKEKYMKLR
jgi:hypothetical protein